MGLQIVNNSQNKLVEVCDMHISDIGFIRNWVCPKYNDSLVIMTYGRRLVNLNKPNETWIIHKFFPSNHKVELLPKGTKFEVVID